ncbi:NACHT domain-containing protein [Corallococcus llansteffanensis]|uniref:NACHT domain-containing protein n=1 Tax=Corallococcus llansteffanensis TaxID=2316731 RepID=A0A3A8PL12_9BACT|nr:NACHT domain-containing protein [Corallococcus llansteffanensis]RKH53212.1 NACHT domain-containing protein [Corallococcus llansteffanensis]
MSHDGTDLPKNASPVLAVIRVQVDLPQDEVSSMVLKARLVAGIHYIAQQFEEADLREVGAGSWNLSLTGANGPDLARKSFDAAKLLRERILMDLALPSRIALHAAVTGDEESLREQALSLCERLQAQTPENAIAVSPDVYRVLEDDVRRQLSPPAHLDGDGLLAAQFPPQASAHGENLWEELLRDLTSPSVRRLHYVGFRLQKKEPPSLDIFDVFVMPSVEVRRKPTPSVELSSDLLRDGGLDAPLGQLTESVQQATTYLPAQRMAFEQAFQRHHSLVVLGDPGSGKTTLLRWLAVVGAGGPLAMHAALGSTAPPLPLLVSVGHLAQVRSTLGADTSVVEALAHLFHSRGISSDEASLRGFLERRLEQGDCLVLLDGLDEVRSEARADLMRWLEAFAARYPRNRFIASARQVGYVGLALPDAVEVELGAFEDEQVRRYVRSFHRAYRQWEEGRPDDVTADRESERLLKALFANQRLHELSRNPFILASLALIHRAEGQLPRHRVQAYEIFARTLCETWGQARRLIAAEGEEAQIRYEEEAVPILGRLALEMHRQWPNGVAPEDFVIETLATALQERDGISREEAERSAREFLLRAGQDVQILMERGPKRWGFLHLTFQEFFAAVGLHASETFDKVALAHLFDPRWEEVLRLGVGYMALVQKRPEATRRFIQQVLERQESGPRQVLTQTLRVHVPAAALFAAEAGDALPASMQARIAQTFCEWLCAMPPLISQPALRDVELSDFASRLSPVLERFSHSELPRVRANAFLYIGLLNPERTSQLLTTMRTDPAPEVRSAATALLIEQRSVESFNDLRALLLDGSPALQTEAAIGIMIAHPKHFADALEILLGRGSEQALPIAMLAYSWVGSEEKASMLRRWKGSSNTNLAALATVLQDAPDSALSRPSAVPPPDVLIQMLEASDEEKRIAAIHALGSTDRLDAIAPLTRLAQSSITKEADAAMNAIWMIANAAGLRSPPHAPT